MDLTNQHEVEARLHRDLTEDELSSLPSAIRDVSALIRSVAPRVPDTLPIPDAVLGVASWLVISGLVTDPESASSGIASEGLGGYQVSYRTGSGGYTMSEAQIAALKPWARSKLGVIQLDATTAVAR